MSAKIISFEQARGRRPCVRADGSAPRRARRADALAEAFAALDACPQDTGFRARVETFQRAFEAAQRRRSDGER